MMNKGLEVIEASRLFGMPGERIEIVVHPQSVAHGFVVFNDGSVKSQLAAPDMRLPIAYALSYPRRLPFDDRGGDVLQALGAKQGDAALRYDFEPPDPQRFPCVRLAYEALAGGGTLPAVLSAANEIAVNAFVAGRIGFGRIPEVIEGAMSRARPEEDTLQGIRSADRRARQTAGEIVGAIEGSISQ
jgi:1-deoxy-D-xylulose-5-phosphate reductoisomerase